MNKNIILVVMLLFVVTLLSASQHPFIDEVYYPRHLVTCFSAEAVGNLDGKIDFNIENGIVSTNREEFNRLAEEFRIVNMEQMHDNITHPEWNSNGIHLQNIYRLVLEKNDNIEAALLALKNFKDVVFSEYESINRPLYTPNDPDFHLQWHHPVMNNPEAWDYVQGDSEVIIAISDSGVKWNHPDLADNIWINEEELVGITINWETGQILGGDGIDNDGNGVIDDVMGWDFYDNNNNPYQYAPGSNHGTHVAGCAGAVGDNNIGLTGVVMNTSLMVLKGAPTGQPSSSISQGYNQITYAAQTGADIINTSWIGYAASGVYANSVVDYATSLGSLVIGGAGNSDYQHIPSYAGYPASCTNSLAVAATDSNDIKADFSDYGQSIDLIAPGVNIRSTSNDDSYNSSSGTSMASPIAAGAAALVKSLHPEMTPLELKNRLMATTDYIDDLNPNYAGLLGTGRVNSFKATMYDKIPNISIYNQSVSEHDGDGDEVPNPGEEINVVFSLYNEFDWITAANVSATLTPEIAGVEMLVGTVAYPSINGGSIVFNTNQPFRFTTDEALSNLSIPMTLTITANPDQAFPFVKSFPIEIELSLQQAGWPLATSGTSTSTALIHDINNDGTQSIIFGDPQGNLIAVDANQNSVPGFPVNLGGNISSHIAIAGLIRQDSVEIVANTQNGFINCVDNEGNILFQYNAEGQLRSNPMLVDVNNNGSYEIVALTFTNPKLIILNADGSEYQGFPVNLTGAVLSSAASADLNGDGHKEIIFATTTGNIHAVSTLTGQDISGWPQNIGSASWNGPVVSDISGNNEPDIAVANVQGGIYAFDRQGNQIFNRNVGNAVRTSVLVFDLDNDGSSEIVFADMTGKLYVLDSSGEDFGIFPVDFGTPIESTPVLADMNNDGNYEMIFVDGSGFLHSFTVSGQNTDNFPIDIVSSSTVSPSIGYVVQDGTPDILVPNGDGYNFIDFKRPIGSIGWAYFKGNIRRTGNSFDMLNIEHDGAIAEPGLVTKLQGNYPNPFNPETIINFSVANESNVELTIYNIRGQRVNSLVNERIKQGSHSAVWNGTDDSGKAVSSGIYFYIMQSDDYRSAKKMILLK